MQLKYLIPGSFLTDILNKFQAMKVLSIGHSFIFCSRPAMHLKVFRIVDLPRRFHDLFGMLKNCSFNQPNKKGDGMALSSSRRD